MHDAGLFFSKSLKPINPENIIHQSLPTVIPKAYGRGHF
jgi:hypothetical protein